MSTAELPEITIHNDRLNKRRAVIAGKIVRLKGSQEGKVLAALIASTKAGTLASVDRLAAAIWGDDPDGWPADYTKNVQGAISGLRQRLVGHLVIDCAWRKGLYTIRQVGGK